MSLVDLGDDGVQRRRLAAAGRTGDQNHAVRLGAELAQPRGEQRVEPELVERKPAQRIGQRLLIEDAQNGVLAEHARHHRHAEVDLASAAARLEAPVLRHAPLGDVQLRHDLDARDHLLGELDAAHRLGAGEDAVDPVLDRQAGAGRFEMDVARAGLQRIIDRRVD